MLSVESEFTGSRVPVCGRAKAAATAPAAVAAAAAAAAGTEGLNNWEPAFKARSTLGKRDSVFWWNGPWMMGRRSEEDFVVDAVWMDDDMKGQAGSVVCHYRSVKRKIIQRHLPAEVSR